MAKLLAVSVVTLSLANFGTCFAQNTAQPSQPPPTQQNQPSRTTGAQTSHSTSLAHVQLYKTEADAKSHCGTDQVVWGNSSSHVLHDPGTKYYGKTTHGGYLCKGMAVNAGYHEPKQ
jgi:hypothetical protein